MTPKKAATFTVEFRPPGPGSFSHELQLRVKANPFEQHRIALTGECVQVGPRGALAPPPLVSLTAQTPAARLPRGVSKVPPRLVPNFMARCQRGMNAAKLKHAEARKASSQTLPQEDVTLDGLPGGAIDELRLGDVRLGRGAGASFTLTNRSEAKTFRCARLAACLLPACLPICLPATPWGSQGESASQGHGTECQGQAGWL